MASRRGSADRSQRGLGGKPRWLRAPLAIGEGYEFVRRTVREHRLATVCEEAKCPNIGECWNAGTATIMLMGAVCTRACRFCAVDTGNPRGWLDAEEPAECCRQRGADAAAATWCSPQSIAMIWPMAARRTTRPASAPSSIARPRPPSRR